MDAAGNASLPEIFQAVIGLLEQTNTPYLLIGGIAQAVIGEPRMTQDVDCFERNALQRAQRVRLYDRETCLPTPEDLILLKLVPGRDKDLLDAKIVAVRYRAALDRGYLQQWAQRFSDEAEDARVSKTLQQILRDVDAMS